MAWWQDALCAIGLATCAPPHPDVSAHTILNLLIQSGGNTEVFPVALGALYEMVELQETGTYLLGRDGQVFAQTACQSALNCTFLYRDNPKRLSSFALQAEVWAEHEIGPLEYIDETTSRAATREREILIKRSQEAVHLTLR